MTFVTEMFTIADVNSYLPLGIMLNWGLYGALSAQVYLYYLAFPEDKTFNKALVYGIYILETAQAILLLTIGIYYYGYPPGYAFIRDVLAPVLKFPTPRGASTITYFEWTSIPLLGGLTTFAVQSFYAYRLRILARSRVIMILIVSLALSQFVVTITGGCLLFSGPMTQYLWVDMIYDVISLPLAWTALSIACDVVIAAAMTYFLLRNDNGWKSTHTLLVKLVSLAIETGAVTVVVSVICLVLLYVAHYNPFRLSANSFYPPLLVLGKVYSNAMMANFNHRIKIYNGRNDPESTSFVDV